jgi:hypothetical protein
MKLITFLALFVPSLLFSQTVLINEVVTDPQQDWSNGSFSGTPGGDTPDTGDEWIEIYIGTAGLDLTGWTIQLNDGSDISGDLTNTGAFTVSNYITTGTGTFENTEIGDYLILGSPNGGDMLDNITIILSDGTPTVIDQVIIGSGGTVFTGDATGTGDESVCRIPNGQDTGIDADDFVKTRTSLGSNNSPTGIVLINEVIVDAQQDWSGGGFSGTPSGGTINENDEWIELYIGTSGLNLLKWNIVVDDGSPFSGDLTSRDATGTGAFQEITYFGTGNFENTVAGDYLILGNPQSSEDIGLEPTVTLTDADGATIDVVVVAAATGTMVNGNSTGVDDESVCRIPNGEDTNVDADDFVKTRATMGNSNSPNGIVLINEVVTDPQTDWDTNGFDGTDGISGVSDNDEWIELYIGTAGLNLTKWTLDMIDGTDQSGELTTSGPFAVVNYVGSGSFLNTQVGDYLILGNPTGSINDDIYLVLRDASGNIVDDVELGDDDEADGNGDGAPYGGTSNGNASSAADESISRNSIGIDTGNDIADFEKTVATLGAENGLSTVYVDATAANDFGLGTIGDPKQLIQSGVDLALSGGTVIVLEGSYAESVIVTKALTIQGPNVNIAASGTRNTEAIINPGSFGAGFTITADNVTIDGFQFGIDNSTSNITLGISSVASNSLDFSNNIIFANAAGISVSDISSGSLTISDNEIELLGLGFAGTGTVGIALQELTGTVDADITDNDITGASWGILSYGLSATPSPLIDGGTFVGCTQGISTYNVNSAAEFSPSTYTIQNVTMSGFVDTGAGLTQPDAEAGIYAFVSGAGADADDLDLTIDNVDISGVESIRSDFSAIYIADFADDDNAITVDIMNSNIHDNQNRGIFIRGQNATATITTSRIEGNGFNPTAAGGNPGFSVIARNGSITNVSNCFIVNPSSLTGVEDIGNNYYVSGLHMSAAATLVVTDCNLDDNGNGFIAETSGLDLSGNYFGTTDESTILSLVGASNDFTPWIDSGVDTDLVTAGFQPDLTVVHVGLSGVQTGGGNDRIQEAHDLLAAGDTVIIQNGTYPELFTATKRLVLQPASSVSLDELDVAIAGDTLTIDGDILLNDAITLTDGILEVPGLLTIGPSIADLPAETTNAHVAGNVSSGARNVGTGVLTSILGVALSSGTTDIGNVTIERSSGSVATVGTLPSGPPDNRSIDIRWDISSTTPPTSRDITFSWSDIFDNGNDPTNLVVYRSTTAGVWNEYSGTIHDLTNPGPLTNPRMLTETGVTGFSVWTVAEDAEALPVELISFAATPDNGRVLLSWETATELNNDRFEVECSSDGVTFNRKGSVDGNGTTSERNNYSFLDMAPMSGINYYRLKQIDYDGAFEYSKTIWINPFESDELLIYPNPANDELTIVGNGLLTEKNVIRVLDIEGREMTTIMPSMNEQDFKLDVKNYPVGIYIIEIAAPDKMYRYKFMKD